MTSLETLSLYPLVLGADTRSINTNSVQTLLAISHSIEDVVMRYHFPLTFYAGFQRVSSFLPQIERFARLAATCGEVLVFAQFDAPVPDIPGVQFVELAPGSPLTQEWFIVADHEAFGAVLLTRQLSIGSSRVTRADALEFGRGRLYEGLVTFDTELVAATRRALDEALGRAFVPVARAADSVLAIESPYNQFGRSLVIYLEHNNQHVLGLYHTLAQRTRELERLQRVVRTMVSQKAWEEVQADPAAAPNRRTTMEVQQLTILFSDVQGFSRLSDSVDPELLLDSLNQYLDILATTVYQARGDIDKFLGDGMLAFFEDPFDALHAAILLQKRVHSFNAQQVAALKPTLPTRVGLATGISLIGRVGSQDRQEITVMGDAVNLANRLQAKAPVGGIVLDEATYEFCGWPEAALRTMARIHGKSGLQTIYEIEPARLDTCERNLADVQARRPDSPGE